MNTDHLNTYKTLSVKDMRNKFHICSRQKRSRNKKLSLDFYYYQDKNKIVNICFKSPHTIHVYQHKFILWPHYILFDIKINIIFYSFFNLDLSNLTPQLNQRVILDISFLCMVLLFFIFNLLYDDLHC